MSVDWTRPSPLGFIFCRETTGKWWNFRMNFHLLLRLQDDLVAGSKFTCARFCGFQYIELQSHVDREMKPHNWQLVIGLGNLIVELLITVVGWPTAWSRCKLCPIRQPLSDAYKWSVGFELYMTISLPNDLQQCAWLCCTNPYNWKWKMNNALSVSLYSSMPDFTVQITMHTTCPAH